MKKKNLHFIEMDPEGINLVSYTIWIFPHPFMIMIGYAVFPFLNLFQNGIKNCATEIACQLTVPTMTFALCGWNTKRQLHNPIKG